MKVEDTIPDHMKLSRTYGDVDEWRGAVYNLRSPNKHKAKISHTGNHEYVASLDGYIVGEWSDNQGWAFTVFGYNKRVIADLLK